MNNLNNDVAIIRINHVNFSSKYSFIIYHIKILHNRKNKYGYRKQSICWNLGDRSRLWCNFRLYLRNKQELLE
ncbi:unnamed protein product [Leptidea sinapis]|uniref:Uncharacterized protein n=1 Tax=Leptidea sinapis TaxID=189913 RepID=A0A5E4PQU7_9NEOP|nr:unnamed protein product [Leptidea sinapis]